MENATHIKIVRLIPEGEAELMRQATGLPLRREQQPALSLLERLVPGMTHSDIMAQLIAEEEEDAANGISEWERTLLDLKAMREIALQRGTVGYQADIEVKMPKLPTFIGGTLGPVGIEPKMVKPAEKKPVSPQQQKQEECKILQQAAREAIQQKYEQLHPSIPVEKTRMTGKGTLDEMEDIDSMVMFITRQQHFLDPVHREAEILRQAARQAVFQKHKQMHPPIPDKTRLEEAVSKGEHRELDYSNSVYNKRVREQRAYVRRALDECSRHNEGVYSIALHKGRQALAPENVAFFKSVGYSIYLTKRYQYLASTLCGAPSVWCDETEPQLL